MNNHPSINYLDDYEGEIDTEQLRKFIAENIKLERLVDNSLEIKNMESYLISTLYVESLSGALKEQADLHDDYLRYLRGSPYQNIQ